MNLLKEKPDRGMVFRSLVISTVLISFAVFVFLYHKVDKTEMVSTEGRTFEKAVVTQIVTDNLQEDGTRAGSQTLIVRMLTGEMKGELVSATSSDGNLFGAVCSVGDKVVVIVSTAGDESLVSVYSLDRENFVYAFVAIFILLLCLIGGKNGIKSAMGLIFTVGSILYVYMPMIYRGVSPFIAAIVISILTTIVTMYLVGGATVKTLSSILGTVIGVLIAGIAAFLFGKCTGISGYNVSDIENLLYIGQNTKIKIGGLLFSGIIIASLGAVIDTAMSIASTINEIHDKNPGLSSKELFVSGMNVGKDMMGTMSNTLILAFTGGSLSILVTNYVYDLSFRQMINSYSIGIEIMQGISGSLGVILTVPFVSMISTILLKRKQI